MSTQKASTNQQFLHRTLKAQTSFREVNLYSLIQGKSLCPKRNIEKSQGFYALQDKDKPVLI